MTILEKLQKIQVELKVTKNQTNAFGKYKYRSAEDILEAVKPFEDEYNVVFKITDALAEVAGHVYVDSEAKIIDVESTDRESSISSTAQAIIDFSAKGMQMPQRTGAASSYAKKYALGNLLLIDDNKDSDATNTHGKSKPSLKLGSEEYKKVKAALAGGNFTLAQVKTKYVLSAEIEKSLV
tara:strand:- start:185 stop:727 length:543 start_codon:yes stop_codon:yes gene_type:complete